MTLLLQQSEASHDNNTRHRVMLLLIEYVQIQLMLMCLVTDLICQGLGGETPQRERRLVRRLQYCNNLHFIL